MFIQLMKYMEENNICFDDKVKVRCITAGGWKRFEGQKIDQLNLKQQFQRYFKAFKFEHMLDTFNMVELNQVMAGCTYEVKHVQPWVKVFVLSPEDLKPVAPGEMGLLAYLDPTCLSYPGFIITDDFCVLETSCPCGKELPGFRIIRRVNTGEQRGCALKLDKAFG